MCQKTLYQTAALYPTFPMWSYLVELFWLSGLNFQSCPTFSLKMFPLKAMCFTDLKGTRLHAACTHPSKLTSQERGSDLTEILNLVGEKYIQSL